MRINMRRMFLAFAMLLISTPLMAAQQAVTVGTSGSPASLDTNFGNIQSNFAEIYGITSGLGTAATTASTAYATAAQGLLADSALQPAGSGASLTGIVPAQVGLEAGTAELSLLSITVPAGGYLSSCDGSAGGCYSELPLNTVTNTPSAGKTRIQNLNGVAQLSLAGGTYYDLLTTASLPQIEFVAWTVKDSDIVTAVADGKQAFIVPALMNGMNLTDCTAAVADLNGATSGDTTVVIRRVRGATAVDMTSTGVTVAYTDYSASDEVVDTANDDIATGDHIYVDVNAVTTAVQKGLSVTCTFVRP